MYKTVNTDLLPLTYHRTNILTSMKECLKLDHHVFMLRAYVFNVSPTRFSSTEKTLIIYLFIYLYLYLLKQLLLKLNLQKYC